MDALPSSLSSLTTWTRCTQYRGGLAFGLPEVGFGEYIICLDQLQGKSHAGGPSGSASDRSAGTTLRGPGGGRSRVHGGAAGYDMARLRWGPALTDAEVVDFPSRKRE